MAQNDTAFNSFFSSLIQDIKAYSGTDPLFPWLRGIKKMKEKLPSNFLKEKLPRFLQKCTQTFESERRYKNDMRYLRVWLELMDYVDDPRGLLRTMEANRIGTKRSLFYQAYALYYEKMKKFEEAEKMYHLGVQNFAEPADELQKSFEQFLHRMERHKKKRIRVLLLSTSRQQGNSKRETDEPTMFAGDDTVVVKFVDKAIVGKSQTEDACHHGLVDPTINMKEAMNAINNMFREPLDTAPLGRRSRRSQKKEDQGLENGFTVFVDDNLDTGIESFQRKEEKGVSLMQHDGAENFQPHQDPFTIFVDDEESDKIGIRNDDKENLDLNEMQNVTRGSSSSSHVSGFVFPCPKDLPSESSDEQDAGGSPRVKLREDTVVHRFVGSTILDEPEVENVCHHGLVDPTINLKEAMADIDNMFGKPIDFVRAKRPKKQEKQPVKNPDAGGFLILADDDLEPQRQAPPKSSKKKSDCDLFEPTMFTKEAMDDINKMFGMPLDF
ncbi:uncharacterized protein LOC116106218 [Pistacia vera]|uniref:uncharacterized protein LOC116106218 n=1 Tax=Pistacia vera TaxID=55513 RepID=UPI001262C33E|nr:uncharacterized protein LOC116106218 [Pistacia vera]